MSKLTIGLVVALVISIGSSIGLLKRVFFLEEQMRTKLTELKTCADTLKNKKKGYKKALKQIQDITKEAADAKCTLKSITGGTFRFPI